MRTLIGSSVVLWRLTSLTDTSSVVSMDSVSSLWKESDDKTMPTIVVKQLSNVLQLGYPCAYHRAGRYSPVTAVLCSRLTDMDGRYSSAVLQHQRGVEAQIVVKNSVIFPTDKICDS